MAVDPINGDVMVFVYSDTLGVAFEFLKLTPDGSPATEAPHNTTTMASILGDGMFINGSSFNESGSNLGASMPINGSYFNDTSDLSGDYSGDHWLS